VRNEPQTRRMEPTDFCYDIDDPAYEKLWPYGELWCLELDVYHNPKALYPSMTMSCWDRTASGAAGGKFRA
jgi:hypothetical protein